MESIVSLDLETTGLDPVKDTIIEIGAVRFKGRRVEAEFQTLINPGRSIPQNIVTLTGISNAMVRNAPRLQEVAHELRAFVGDSPVLGHNVKFDLGFVRARGMLEYNTGIDTYDLASVLMPSAGRYNLGALRDQLNVPMTPGQQAHRALDDAQVTRSIFLQFYEMANALPIDLLAEIVRMGDQVDWGGGWLFREVMRERFREPLGGGVQGRDTVLGPLFEKAPRRPTIPMVPDADPVPLDYDEVASILEYGGEFSQYFPNYEFRPEQVEMLRHVTWALSESQHLLIEAGTGTGKSVAYLVPAALWAIQNQRRVIVSTNTINLQDQLIEKDIPDIKNALGLDLRAVVQKGRANYLCPRRLQALRRKQPETPEEVRTLAKVLVWLQETKTGDKQEINLTGPAERMVWDRISAADDACSNDTCISRMGGICPFYRVRQDAQAAHILIVNHALLLADVATGNRVLPEYEYLIVDEAHHMESAVTNALSFKVTQNDVERVIRDLGGTNAGLFGRLLTSVQNAIPPSNYGALHRMIEGVTDHTYQFQNYVRNFFASIDDFLRDQRDGRELGMYAQQVRVLPSTRTLQPWMEVEATWDDAGRPLRALVETVEAVGTEVASLYEAGVVEVEEVYSALGSSFRQLNELSENLEGFVFKPNPEMVYWAEVQPNRNRLSVHAAPLHIGTLMQKYIWHEKMSAIMTSATLTAYGEFEYLKTRLNAVEAEPIAVGSPFDYESQAMLYLINNIPEPSDRRGHQQAVEQGLIALCKEVGGRTMALFTSYDQLRRTSERISGPLAEHGIVVYSQGSGASATTLLDNFKTTEQAVLLGTRSFWEGVDVPGDALSVLAIIKIPFDVPSDPIIASRAETFENPFQEYSLPEAILRIRQGFGRLIRTKQDRGVVVSFDRRLLTKTYGRGMVQSLPPAHIEVGTLQDLAKKTAEWLGL